MLAIPQPLHWIVVPVYIWYELTILVMNRNFRFLLLIELCSLFFLLREFVLQFTPDMRQAQKR